MATVTNRTPEYAFGEPITLEAVFELQVNSAYVKTDPTEVKLFVQKPKALDADNDSEFDTISKTWPLPDAALKSAVGVFQSVVVGDIPGRWKVRWEGLGACQAVLEYDFIVRKNSIT